MIKYSSFNSLKSDSRKTNLYKNLKQALFHNKIQEIHNRNTKNEMSDRIISNLNLVNSIDLSNSSIILTNDFMKSIQSNKDLQTQSFVESNEKSLLFSQNSSGIINSSRDKSIIYNRFSRKFPIFDKYSIKSSRIFESPKIIKAKHIQMRKDPSLYKQSIASNSYICRNHCLKKISLKKNYPSIFNQIKINTRINPDLLLDCVWKKKENNFPFSDRFNI